MDGCLRERRVVHPGFHPLPADPGAEGSIFHPALTAQGRNADGAVSSGYMDLDHLANDPLFGPPPLTSVPAFTCSVVGGFVNRCVNEFRRQPPRNDPLS
jgi:hypothetical protein